MDVAGGVLDRPAPAGAVASGADASTRGPDGVVVGVDASLGVLTAVSWAASEAAAHGVALHLVHVSRPRAGSEEGAAAGRVRLRRALHAAAAIAPDIAITATQLDGPPGPTLAEHARHADRLVIGGRRRRDPVDPVGDRTVPHLLDRARCPVVVVPPFRTGAWASTPSARPVLAGLRGSDDDHPALELAAAAARRRGVALVAAVGGPEGERRTAIARARRAGARRLEVTDDLLDSLRHLGRQSQLLVLARTGRGTGTAGPDEDLERLLHHRPCAVMVTPPR
ncbi:universal stress protein [Actinomycetospora cinnamomea]|uniref:Universal stress protein family protein n=1 Tax=Actinomycetospora cinnamomea TaxID=663609 RepID=A0A2U1EZK1_9PSEU|nr:universal stress protein [Actinomycetospora cinnamomea]PVZ05346.1 universal stress protein family protein [Actinomycetospora cinnamomea]